MAVGRHIFHWTADGGSVLVEFLLVAPLYLLLFGGLMLTNDLARLKNKAAVLDAYVTIGRTHRLCGRSASAVDRHVKELFASFLPGAVSSPYAFGEKTEGTDGKAVANKWQALYGGRIDVEYKMPTLFLEMMAVRRILFGSKDESKPMTMFRFYADPKSGEFPDDHEARFFQVQRFWEPGGDHDVDRTAKGESLVGDGILGNVLADGWLFVSDDDTASARLDTGKLSEYEQTLGEYAE